MDKLKGVKDMRNKKKNHPQHHQGSSLIKKIITELYLIIAIMSIMNHKISSFSNLLAEITVYTCLTISLNLMLENVSIKQIKEDIKLLFD